MKTVFLWIFIVLIFLSVIAWKIQPQPVDKNKTVLTWVSDDNPVRSAQASLFNSLYRQFHLRLDPGNSGAEKIIVQSMAGVGPDLFDCYSAAELEAYVKSGIVWDVTDELKKSGIDINKSVWPVAYPTSIYEGHVYGFPTNTGAGVLWFNKAIFDRYHVPYLKGSLTWKQIVPIAQKLTIRDSNGRVKQYGLMCDWSGWSQFVRQWGGKVYTDDGTRCIVDSPEAIAGIQFMHDLVYKYRVTPSPSEESTMATKGGWGSGSISLFGGSKSAMALGGRWWLCTLRGYDDLRLGAVEPPHGRYRIFIGYSRSTLICRNSPRRYEALMFLKYAAGREYNELVNHQADGLAPVKQYSYTGKYLHDPAYPSEDFNAVWRDTMRYTEPSQRSPFIVGQADTRIINKQLDLVKTNQKSAADAMRTAARQINEEIQKSIKVDPALHAKYYALIRKAK